MSYCPMAEELGYEEKTTFWVDFSIADRFGESAVRDTFNRAFEEWKSDYVYLTELVMILNWKCWQWYGLGNLSMSKLYEELYYKAHDYASTTLKDEELEYYYATTD